MQNSAALRLYTAPDDWSSDQMRAHEAVDQWRATWRSTKQFFTLGGYAGTGKTTLVSQLAQDWACCAVAALCGKAADVLRRKGVEQAQTIHSLIYAPFEDDFGKVRFRRREALETESGEPVSVVIVDEASMVDDWIHNDLLSFEVPILYVGDHGQLEPIGRDSGLMREPDCRLEKIHRQAADNPIIRLATAFREGRRVPRWTDPKGRLRTADRADFEGCLTGTAQAVCGFNKTRHGVNARIRGALGFKGGLPSVGERVICLRNNKTYQLFNGQQAICRGRGKPHGGIVDLEIETESGRWLTVPCLRKQFGYPPLEEHRDPNVCLFDFGYCLTAHKAQGSEWDEVVVLEELSSVWDARRWRYTVVTRAKERLVYCGV